MSYISMLFSLNTFYLQLIHPVLNCLIFIKYHGSLTDLGKLSAVKYYETSKILLVRYICV